MLPTANPDDLLSKEDIEAYAETFPEGYFVAIVDGRPVGMGAGILLNFNFDSPQHALVGITGEHQCGNHDSSGDWYYGTDMSVLPQFRRKGIGRALYARKSLVVRHNKMGIIAGGSLSGFLAYKADMDIQEYVDRVVAGELRDSTLTFQMGNGFRVRGLLENYVDDEADDGWAALIVWDNTEYRPPG